MYTTTLREMVSIKFLVAPNARRAGVKAIRIDICARQKHCRGKMRPRDYLGSKTASQKKAKRSINLTSSNLLQMRVNAL